MLVAQVSKKSHKSTFLYQAAAGLLSAGGVGLENTCVVFPNRRSALFFRQAFIDQVSEAGQGACWLPTLLTLPEFIEAHSSTRLPTPMGRLLLLYPLYARYFPHHSLEAFIPWGERLLADFDEVDHYRLDAAVLYRNLLALQTLEAEIPTEIADRESLQAFWAGFMGQPLALEQSFLNFWSALGPLYADLSAAMAAKGLAGPGLMARELAARLEAEGPPTLNYQKVWFVGLVGCSPAEEQIIRALTAAGRAVRLDDVDAYYLQPYHEAGRPFTGREVESKAELGHHPLHIEAIEVGGVISQVKAVGQKLRALMQESGFDAARVAVVLPDEAHLLPLLHALPEALTELNVTMGYPLTATGLYTLVTAMGELQGNATPAGPLRRDLLSVLAHPYLSRLPGVEELIKLLAGKTGLRVDSKALSSVPSAGWLIELIAPGATLTENILQLTALLETMRKHATASAQVLKLSTLEQETLLVLHSELIKLATELNAAPPEVRNGLGPAASRRLLNQLLTQLRVPFSGEPLKGLQIMGFLETRLLDFDHVLILSVNEGKLPAASHTNSFIPFAVRRAYGLPTPELQEGLTAYYFYRLLQRAGSASLFYLNDEQNEPSRYLLQLQYELAQTHADKVSFAQTATVLAARPLVQQEIIIPKDEEVLTRLARYTTPGAWQKAFSATGLTSYITCPLQFYYRYVAGIQDTKTEPEFTAREFGTLLHEVLYQLYKKHKGNPLTSESVEALKAEVPDAVQRALAEVEDRTLPEKLEASGGEDKFTLRVIALLVNEVLAQDAKDAPFDRIEVEQEVERYLTLPDGREVKLKGKIDRIDVKGGRHRILDYKTGTVTDRKVKVLAEIITDPAYSQRLQGLFYAYLYGRDAEVSLVPLKSGLQGFHNLYQAEQIAESKEEFAGLLQQLISEILEPSHPFVQHKNPKHCDHCSYRRLCYASRLN